MKTLLLLGLFSFQAVASGSCLPAKLRKELDTKRDPVERYLLLAKVGEKQAWRLLHPPPGSFEQPEQPPLLKRQTIRDVWDLHECAWSELLEALWNWKPQPRDQDAIQEMLRRAEHDEKMLAELHNLLQESAPTEPPPPGSPKPKSLDVIRDVEERLQALTK